MSILRRTPIVAYRYWEVTEDDKLSSPYRTNTVWQPGLQRAECDHKNHLFLSRSDCSCGFYAVSAADAYSYSPYLNAVEGRSQCYSEYRNSVMGAVLLFDTRVGSGTLRSRYAIIAALTIPDTMTLEHREQLYRVARKYDVDLVRPQALQAVAQQYCKTLGKMRLKVDKRSVRMRAANDQTWHILPDNLLQPA